MSMTIDDIIEMWKRDAEIEEMNLDESSRLTPKLHAKYLELLTVSKLQLKRKDMQQKILLRDKWLYYTGVMEKSEMDERGWDYNPFKGARKPLKSDLGYFYDSDPDLQKSQAGIDYIQSTIETLESIMTNITWRHQTIGNMIKWRQFTSGA
tara:strand:+ start:1663 stop:2115 length:453 start_codon:yes stop_codon:yes gene_type:complete